MWRTHATLCIWTYMSEIGIKWTENIRGFIVCFVKQLIFFWDKGEKNLTAGQNCELRWFLDNGGVIWCGVLNLKFEFIYNIGLIRWDIFIDLEFKKLDAFKAKVQRNHSNTVSARSSQFSEQLKLKRLNSLCRLELKKDTFKWNTYHWEIILLTENFQ